MNKRLVKRRKRQVARAREWVKFSEPDVETPEQLAAARVASRALSRRNDPHATYFTPSVNHAGRAKDSPAKVETGS
jgi:hypothetical protein